MTLACNDRHLLHMAVKDRTAFSKQLAACCSTATGLLMLASSIRRCLLHHGLHLRVLLYRIPFMANYRQLGVQWAHEHCAWQADWHQVVFSDESCFSLWDQEGSVRVRRYAGQSCLPEYVIKRHSDLKLRIMVWGAISYRR